MVHREPEKPPPGSGTKSGLSEGSQEFSLVLGGPVFQLLRRARLSTDHLQLLRRRIIVIASFCWLPLLILSAIEGRLFGGVAVPFLWDVETHVKFLVAVPLLVAAELVVHRRLRHVARQFVDRGLIPEADVPRFDAAFSSAYRWRNSVVAEILLIAFVYGVGILVVWRQYTALDASTWYASSSEAGSKLSLAGLWYGYLSLPAFQFLLLRWYYRIAIWARYLWQVSRIPLALVPTHPDRTGGLGFIAATAHGFGPLATAHGALLAGQIANRVFYLGEQLPTFKAEIGLLVAVVMLLVFAPLLVFIPQLARAKLKGAREYDTLAQRYVREFDSKWLRGGAPADEPLVGSADIQSLADMGGSLDVVREMRIAPISRGAIIQLGVAVLAPIAPLALTMMPLDELLRKLLGVVF